MGGVNRHTQVQIPSCVHVCTHTHRYIDTHTCVLTLYVQTPIHMWKNFYQENVFMKFDCLLENFKTIWTGEVLNKAGKGAEFS